MYSLPSSSSISSVDSSTSETISSFWQRGDVKAILITLAVLLGIWIIGKFLAPYFVRIDNVFFVSGAPGTGKDLICSDYALKRYTCAMRKYNFAHFVSKLTRKPCNVEKPAFYSSVPILLKREVKLFGKVLKPAIISKSLTKSILLLQDRVPNGSIVYISDINRFVNQWSYKLPCVQKNIAEFISEYRQYSKGGYFICNCQQSDQVAKEIRNCFGSCINLLHHHHFAFVHWSEMRRVSLGENVTAIETKNNDDKNTNRSNLFVLVNPFIRRYDTYAYYGRVAEMDVCASNPYKKANTNVFIEMPKGEERMAVKTFDDDKYSTYFKFDKLAFFLYLCFALLLGILLTLIFKSCGLGFVIGLPMLVCLFALER
jgi:hypothetical protein